LGNFSASGLLVSARFRGSLRDMSVHITKFEVRRLARSFGATMGYGLRAEYLGA
jgi:hypothetical protein